MIRLAAMLLPLVVRIPAGNFQPLFPVNGHARVAVAAFAMDERQVTRGEFLSFVRTHPEWRKGSVTKQLADGGYLADWKGALDMGGRANAPVTGVSWYAAKAYCTAQGKRLPSVNEWEYVAAASASKRDASGDPAFRQQLISLYSTRSSRASLPSRATEVNAYGLRDMHGAVWEWTLDFNMSSPVHHHMQGVHDFSCAGASAGATDPTNYPAFLRNAFRLGLTPTTTLSGLGFRCAS